MNNTNKINKKKEQSGYFTRPELILITLSVLTVAVPFFIFDRSNYLALCASLIGVIGLIFNAKGNPIGQVLIVIFSILYGIISYKTAYYGEMITYLCMTLPMAVIALISWLRHPYEGKRSEVEINALPKWEYAFAAILTAAVTVAFYFILRALGTANLAVSTFSVATSFAAVYLTFRRSPYFAVLYGANDVVLIILWALASRGTTEYIAVIACFVAFLANDAYGFISWKRMSRKQKNKL